MCAVPGYHPSNVPIQQKIKNGNFYKNDLMCLI